MIATYHGKADCSAAEVLAVNPFAPLQTATRLRGYDGLAPARANDAAMAIQANLYRASITERMKDSLSGAKPKLALAPRGPVAGTVDVVKT